MTNTVDPTSGLGQVELLRRLKGVASKAAAIIAPGRAVSLTLLNQSENTTYLVTDTASGEARILRIHRTGAGETAARIAARMPFADHRLRRFLVLNGLNRDQSFPTGHRVKTVTE